MPSARDIVKRIQQQVGCEWSDKTIDTFKAGDPDAPLTGVATTFLATLDVLRRAREAELNFIITHEPTFYNHVDDTSGLKDDPVLAAKRSYLDAQGLVVWRFHDHWHRRRPDGIVEGVARAVGWTPYQRADEPVFFDIPETTVGGLAADLAAKLGSHVPRVVGEPGMRVARVGIAPGAAPSRWHFDMLQRDDVDVLVVGEAREWEAVEYVRDAVAAGRAKALVLLGHAASEEAGMQFCAEWLRGFVSEVPVQFVPAGDPFALRAATG